jgi:hypothetical protein
MTGALAATDATSGSESRIEPPQIRKTGPPAARGTVDRVVVTADSSSKVDLPGRRVLPHRAPEGLQLGLVFNTGETPCGEGLPLGAVCTHLTVACPGLPENEALIAVTEPITPPIATMILNNGSGGTTFFDNGFPVALLNRGIRVVQVAWVSDWPSPSGFKVSACRPSSVFQWIFENVHHSDRGKGFCALGHSGGSAAVGYSLSFYGLGDTFDFVLLNSGPPTGRIDYGCETGLYPPGTRDVCPLIPAAPVGFEASRWDEINPVESTVTCGDPQGDASDADIAHWANDSLVSTGGIYDFPQTTMSFYYCSTDPNSAVGLGSFYVEAVSSEKTVHCVGGECVGEGTYRDPEAFQEMVDDMATSCVPNHGP